MVFIKSFRVQSPNLKCTDGVLETTFTYNTTRISSDPAISGIEAVATPLTTKYHFRTNTHIGRVGVMLVGLGGNNGSTALAGIIANRHNITWQTKYGLCHPNYLGSVVMSSTTRIGHDALSGEDVFAPLRAILPMAHPDDLVVGGWDISSLNLADAMKRAQVLDYDLQRQLVPYLKEVLPLPSLYYPDFIAANQTDRADNLIPGTDKAAHLEHIRSDIRNFKRVNQLDTVIVLWTANTERFCDVQHKVHGTADNLLASIAASHAEISPSTIFAVASILEGAPFINGSPQNTFVPGCIELAERHNVFIAGDDFKSGQTKFKSVMVDFLVGAGIKPRSIVSYNHLGNNDGKNLSAPSQFRSKEISKSNVVDDVVGSNRILYADGESPDNVVVIKYVPTVGDSKRAMDEYVNEIFMGGVNTIVTHNTCEDSLLAVPLIYDLVLLCELSTRITYRTEEMTAFETFHPVLSLVSYMLKAPVTPPGTPVVNALFKQRNCIENVLRVCAGLHPENDMRLEHRAIPGSHRYKAELTANGKKSEKVSHEELAGNLQSLGFENQPGNKHAVDEFSRGYNSLKGSNMRPCAMGTHYYPHTDRLSNADDSSRTASSRGHGGQNGDGFQNGQL